MFEVLTDKGLILKKLNEFRPQAENFAVFNIYSQLLLIWATDFSELFDARGFNRGPKNEVIESVKKVLEVDSDSSLFVREAMTVSRSKLTRRGNWSLVSNDLTEAVPNILFGILKDSD